MNDTSDPRQGGDPSADGTGRDLVRQSPSALTPAAPLVLPAIVAHAGEDAARHFLEFFIARIRNPNTRRAYGRQVRQFYAWCETHAGVVDVREIGVAHVAAYIELLSQTPTTKPSTVKQALAAIRMLGNWLVVKQVLPSNPAAPVSGPKLVVTEGATPILEPWEAAKIFEAIPTDTMIGLRDRALIGVMAYTFARVGAAVSMNVEDYYPQGNDWIVLLHEKGGKQKRLAAHHMLQEYLHSYIEAAGIGGEKGTPLFRTAWKRSGRLTENRMCQQDAWNRMQLRAREAGVATRICNHTWRGTGITTFLLNGGELETAQWIANHSDPRTTKLYDHRRQRASRSEVERIRYERGTS